MSASSQVTLCLEHRRQIPAQRALGYSSSGHKGSLGCNSGYYRGLPWACGRGWGHLSTTSAKAGIQFLQALAVSADTISILWLLWCLRPVSWAGKCAGELMPRSIPHGWRTEWWASSPASLLLSQVVLVSSQLPVTTCVGASCAGFTLPSSYLLTALLKLPEVLFQA